MESNLQCPFCDIANEPSHHRIIQRNDHAFLIRDGFPVSKGHSLIIPNRHVGSFFDLTDPERKAMLGLLDVAKTQLGNLHHPDGYNIGVNDGPVAGQTVPHCHLHLISRYAEECGGWCQIK